VCANVFLTGSTGTIGRRWLPFLLEADTRRKVTVLVRDAGRALKHPRVSVLAGDLRSPRLGLARSVWDGLATSVTDMIHCASDVRFNRPLAEVRATNAEGTRTMLALARDAKRLRRFAFIGTAWIMGRDTGELPEHEYRNTAGFVNTYEQSKYEAERLVFASMDEIPAAVFRLSSVAGDRTNYLHQTLRLIPRNPFPLIPALPNGRIDLIGEHWAGAALNTLFERCFRPGAVFNICAGRQASIPVWQLIEMAFSGMRAARQPSMVSLQMFERFAELFLSNGAREMDKVILRSVRHFLPHLALEQTFRNEATIMLLRENGMELADSREVFRKVLARVSSELTREPVPAGEAIG
jgi:nucleoside-diphosphate-sugar epimerase